MAKNSEEAKEKAQYLYDTDADSDDIDFLDYSAGDWFAELDEESLVEDLQNIPVDDIANVLNCMFE